MNSEQEEFEDTIGVIIICKSKKNRQHNGQKEKKKWQQSLQHCYINSFEIRILHFAHVRYQVWPSNSVSYWFESEKLENVWKSSNKVSFSDAEKNQQNRVKQNTNSHSNLRNNVLINIGLLHSVPNNVCRVYLKNNYFFLYANLIHRKLAVCKLR